jgi:membrane-bound serine protease (ClpP class)
MSKRSFIFIIVVCIIAFLPALVMAPRGAAQSGDQPLVLVIRLDGPLSEPMFEYLKRGLQAVEARGAEALVIQLNTPGGEITLMTRMVQAIRASSIPVVVYVSPRGAMAGSAGTILTLAGHASAMAPETAIGAASPVGGSGEDLAQTEAAKQKNIMKATVRSLASQRSPEAISLAEQTIETAQAASASEALQVGLVDFIADNIPDLLEKLDGFTVQTSSGAHTLHTANAEIEEVNSRFIEQLLGALTNPNIVFLLLTIGVQAILIELSSPGGWVAGFVGVVSLALAIYGLGILPVNWFGIVFLIIAFGLFLLDIKAPTHGALTLAGVGSLIVSALVLFNSPGTPRFARVSIPLVVGVSIVTAGIFFTILTFALRAQKIPVQTGQESLAGRVGVARTDINPVGSVHVFGEVWSAELAPGEAPIPAGARVQVVSTAGLRLLVRQAG